MCIKTVSIFTNGVKVKLFLSKRRARVGWGMIIELTKSESQL